MPRRKSLKSNKPRGRMTPYSCFIQKCRDEHRKAHPNESVRFHEFVTLCSQRWRKMTGQEKKLFYEMSTVDKKRYEAEMKEFNERQQILGKTTVDGKPLLQQEREIKSQ